MSTVSHFEQPAAWFVGLMTEERCFKVNQIQNNQQLFKSKEVIKCKDRAIEMCQIVLSHH